MEVVTEELFGPFAIRRKSRRKRVGDVVGSVHRIDEGQIVLVQYLVEQPPGDRFVRVCEVRAFGHELGSFRSIRSRGQVTMRYVVMREAARGCGRKATTAPII